MSVDLQSNAVISLADVKTFLHMKDSASDIDDVIKGWINEESDRIEGPSGIDNKVMAQVISEEISDGTGRSKLQPEFYPVMRLSAEDEPTDEQILASVQCLSDDDVWTDIEDDASKIVIRRPRQNQLTQQTIHAVELLSKSFPLGTQNVKITYVAGWETAPADLKRVVLERVALWLKQSGWGDSRFGVQSKTDTNPSGSSISVAFADYSDRHKEMMRPYRRMQ